MNALDQKANGTKTVLPATDKKANTKEETLKNVVKPINLETTAEKRIKNAEHFQKICEKHTFLKQKADELNAYNIGRDGLKEKITIENTDGMEFDISNSVIIGKILTLCANELNDLVEKSEKEVLNFTV